MGKVVGAHASADPDGRSATDIEAEERGACHTPRWAMNEVRRGAVHVARSRRRISGLARPTDSIVHGSSHPHVPGRPRRRCQLTV